MIRLRYRFGMKFILRIIFIVVLLSIFPEKIVCKSYNTVSGHPRILLNKGKERDVKRVINTIPEIKNVHDSILRVSDKIVEWSTLKYKLTGVRLLDISREALRRIFYLSYSYRMTGEKKYADRAIKEMLNVCEFPDWNPSHFLDVGEMTMAVSIGYDWLYDLIKENDRVFIIKAIKEKAFDPSFNNKYSYFYKRTNNWNSICNAGLIYGAIAFMDEMPEISTTIIDKCLSSNPKALTAFSPDGGYPEGYHYWSYGTSSQVLLIDALKTAFGRDFGLSQSKGFLETGRFMQYMPTPSGGCFNFSDSPNKAQGNIVMWWFAKQNNDYSLLYLEKLFFNERKFDVGEIRLLPALPIFASRCKLKKITKPKSECWYTDGLTPLFIYRGGWDSKNDTYLGVKGGSASTSHAHMDAGSFIYEYSGIRWAADLGMQDYYSLESKGVKLWDNKQDGQRWDIMRMRNDCHNTLTIDSLRHNVDAHAEIIQIFTAEDHKGAVIDLTSTLGNLKKAHREVSIDKNDHLHIIDSISTSEKPIGMTWVMVTPAEAKVTGDNEIILKKDNTNMKLVVESPLSVVPHIWENTPMHSYDQSNNGTIRVGFTTSIDSHKNVTFHVKLEPVK